MFRSRPDREAAVAAGGTIVYALLYRIFDPGIADRFLGVVLIALGPYLIFGRPTVKAKEVDSPNSYLRGFLSLARGIVCIAGGIFLILGLGR
jgi:hypothetical protein